MENSSRFFPGPSRSSPSRLHGTERTDPCVVGNKFLAMLLDALELGNLLVRLAQSGGVGETLRDGFVTAAARQSDLGIVAEAWGLAQWQLSLPQRRTTAVNGPGRRPHNPRNSSRSLAHPLRAIPESQLTD